MLIHRMYKEIPIGIVLKHAEVMKAHELCLKDDFEQDFVNRYQERYADGIGLCNLPVDGLLEQPDIRKKAYACYQDMRDCNVAFNDTLDAVIDEIERQMEKGSITLVQQPESSRIVVIIENGIISAAFSSSPEIKLEIVELDEKYATCEQRNTTYELYTKDMSLSSCAYTLSVPGYRESMEMEADE